MGRYVVLAQLGAGAMGIVYSAYDPNLDRRVALKFLHPHLAGKQSPARDRLLREARTLGRLAHPNVIAVHDVSTFGDRVFVAMEYVEGGRTLRPWLTESERPIGAILDVFLQAGRGLAAAHAAGVVHRDFKPDNILIGGDGRARVLDFGVARASWDVDEVVTTQPNRAAGQADADVDANDARTDRVVDPSITGQGVLVGTPRYMAPEQIAGLPVDGRTDQFAFCVTLWEALYGEHPFEAQSLPSLAYAITTGELRPPPTWVRVPVRVRRALLRGLHTDPAQRWPDVESLMDALERARANRRPFYVAGGLAVVTLGGLLGLNLHDDEESSEMCRVDEARFSGVWDDETRRRIGARFAAVDEPYSAAAWERFSTSFDAFIERWRTLYTESCGATRVRGEQSSELLDLRMACLDRQLSVARQIAELYVEADAQMVRHAAKAVRELGGLDTCADAEALRARIRLPDEPTRRAQALEVLGALDRANGMRAAGRGPEALRAAEAAMTRAVELAYPPIIAPARLVLANAQQSQGQFDAAEDNLLEAVHAAEESRDFVTAARAWSSLVLVVGVEQHEVDEALRWARFAETALRRLDDPPPGLRADLERNLGAVYRQSGDYEASLVHLEQALAIEEDEPTLRESDPGTTLLELGNLFLERHELDLAVEYYERSLSERTGTMGEHHPLVIDALGRLGAARMLQGDHEAAEILLGRAVELSESVFGPASIEVAAPVHSLAVLYERTERYDEALSQYRRGLDLRRKHLGDGPETASSLAGIAAVLTQQGELELAIVHYEEALAMTERTLASDHPDVARILTDLATVLHRAGRDEDALAASRRGVQLSRDRLGPTHRELGRGLAVAGMVLHRRGEIDQAELALEEALEILAATGQQHDPQRARAELELADVLWQVGDDRVRARTMAATARGRVAAGSALGREIDAWLHRHRHLGSP